MHCPNVELSVSSYQVGLAFYFAAGLIRRDVSVSRKGFVKLHLTGDSRDGCMMTANCVFRVRKAAMTGLMEVTMLAAGDAPEILSPDL